MNNKAITLLVCSWGNYWKIFGKQWCDNVNNFNTYPDEIIIVSDVGIDYSALNIKNVKNIVVSDKNIFKNDLSLYRNLGVKEATSDWVVISDLDDTQLPNYLDNLDSEVDILGFSFYDSEYGHNYIPDETSLKKRLTGEATFAAIPSTSAIKRHVFDKIRYENSCFEDMIFYSTAHKLNLKASNNDPKSIRFIYSGSHPTQNHKERVRVSNIYKKVLSGDRNIYCCWFSGEMSQNRKKCFEILKNTCGVNLVVINEKSFYEYENEELAIHKGFKYLSDVQKSDYVRAYMMYFYGEGYSDIKNTSFDWNTYFDQLFLSNKDAIGYSTSRVEDIGEFWGNDMDMMTKCKENFMLIAGNGHYIFKPKTEFAYKWLTKIHKMMDDKYEQLKDNPGIHPYQVYGGLGGGYSGDYDPQVLNNNYPFVWAEIGGLVKQVVEYENNFESFILTMPQVNMKNYR